VLLACACGGPEREQLVIYSPHGKELLGATEQAYEKQHPEVDLVWFDLGSQDVLDRIRSESASPQCDLWWGAPAPLFMQAARENLLESYKPTWASEVDPISHDPSDRWYGTYLTPEVIMYNSEALSRSAAPHDWDDLLDPKWKGKILIRHPLASGTMRTIFSALIYRYYRESGSPQQGYDWLRRLDQNVVEYTANPTLLYHKLARREGLVTLWNLTDVILQSRDSGYPFDFIVPQSGTPVVTEGIALVRGARHPQRARAVYEYVTSLERLVEHARRFHRIPVRRDVPRSKLPDWMASLKVQPMQLDWEVLAQNERTWLRYWDEHIRGRSAG
jgi:iron(III) transport system substrate-binding protein